MADTTIKKNQTAEIPTKNGNKYSYQYVDIAQIHEYLEENHMKYYQYIERIGNDDYVMTQRLLQEVDEKGNYLESFIKWGEPLRGSRVVDATLFGNDNPAQKQGSALTYARRYSLLMAFGLATEDDDANSLGKGNKQNGKKSIDNLDNKVTETEAKAIYAIMTKKGVDVVSNLKKNYNISNTKDLTKRQYFSILNAMKKIPDKKDDGYTFTGMTSKTDPPYESSEVKNENSTEPNT